MPGQIRTAMVGTNADGAYSTSLGNVGEPDRDPATFADPALGNNETAGINLGGLVPFARVVDGVSTGISVGGADSTSDIVYSGTYVNGIVLSDPATQNPATVAATGYVTNFFHGDAVYGTPGYSWTLTNLGTIAGKVHLAAGGSVTNGQGALIKRRNVDNQFGVEIDGSSGTVSNFGTMGPVHMTAGGSVANGQSGSTISLINGVEIDGSSGTVSNFGTMVSVYMTAGGSVTNGQSGSSTGHIVGYIFGGYEAVAITGGDGTVVNFGVIFSQAEYGGVGVRLDGSSGTLANFGFILGGDSYVGSYFGGGVYLRAGSVTNGQSGASGGYIKGYNNGVLIYGGNSTVTNFGTIESLGGAGVDLQAGGNVENFGTIGAGVIGIEFAGTLAGTVTNAGTISGNSDAVLFGSGDDLLVVDPGAVFIGKVDGGGGNNTLELAAGTGPGTLGGLGTSFVNFGSVVFDANAAWTVGLDNPAAFTGTISGFASGDFLDLTGRAANSVSYSGGVLTVFNDASLVATLNLVGSYTSADFTLTPDGLGGTDIGIGSSGPLAVTGPPSATMNGATGSGTTSPATTGTLTQLGADTAPAAASVGVTSAPVALFGQFVAAGFHAAADSSGLGTAVDRSQQMSTPVLASPLHH